MPLSFGKTYSACVARPKLRDKSSGETDPKISEEPKAQR